MLSSVTLRPRSATEIVDAMFQLLRAHYPQFATIVAVTFIPQLVLTLLLPSELIGLAGIVAILSGPLATGAVVLAGPLPILTGSGSPARVLALVER